MIKYRPQTDALVRRRQHERGEEAARGCPRDQSEEAVVTAMTATGTSTGCRAELVMSRRGDGGEKDSSSSGCVAASRMLVCFG